MKCKLYLFLIVCLTSLLLVSCSPISRRYANNVSGSEFQGESAVNFDFIMWEVGMDSYGKPLPPVTLEGDELMNRGKFNAAISAYSAAQSQVTEFRAKQALALREASAFGAKADYSSALQSLSSFFRNKGVSSDAVGAVPSVMLGLLYSYKGDGSQALAWLFKGLNMKEVSPGAKEAGKKGLARVVATSTEDELFRFREQWPGETLFLALIKSELARRSGQKGLSITAPEEGADPMAAGLSGGKHVLALLPLSGRYRLLGESTKKGIELAAQQFANELGLNVVYADTRGEPEEAVSQIAAAAQDGNLVAILGPVLPDVSLAASGAARQLGVPLLHFSKREDADFGRGVYRLGITPSSQVRSLIEIVIERGARSIAVVYPDTPAAYELADTFRQEAVAAGIDVPIGQIFKDTPEDVTELATTIENQNVDAIFFSGSLTAASKLFTGFSGQFRAKVLPLGTVLWYDPGKLRKLERAMNGSLFVAPFFQGSTDPVVKQFNESYIKSFGQKANFLAAQGFDAGSLVFEVLERQMSQGGSFDQSLSSIALFEGLTGKITTGGRGDLAREYTVVEFRNGNYLELS